MRRGGAWATIDWHTATPGELDRRRCVATTTDGTTIDGWTRVHRASPGSPVFKVDLDDTHNALTHLHLLTLDPRSPARLLPHISSLVITEETKPQ